MQLIEMLLPAAASRSALSHFSVDIFCANIAEISTWSNVKSFHFTDPFTHGLTQLCNLCEIGVVLIVFSSFFPMKLHNNLSQTLHLLLSSFYQFHEPPYYPP